MAELKAAGVPPELVNTFLAMQEKIKGFFDETRTMPDKGRIEIGGTRFMWLQATGLATTFRDTLTDVYGERGTEQIIYKFGQSLGRSEAKAFHNRFGLKDPLERLAAGPIYFAFSGWAFVEILPSSAPQPNENYILTYNHPNSFEAEAFKSVGKKADHPICLINAGYSSGWCAESFTLPLEAREVSCEAMGDSHCTFIMTHRSKILDREKKFRELLKLKDLKEIVPQDILE
jgi:predicted hydrocarbon binding protein